MSNLIGVKHHNAASTELSILRTPPTPPHAVSPPAPPPPLRDENGATVENGPASTGTKKGSQAVPPRKRSKVSRACDSCRRKKTKCDAGSDCDPDDDFQCSPCKKTGEKCSYSRIPLKRGPVKRSRRDSVDSTGGSDYGSSTSVTSLGDRSFTSPPYTTAPNGAGSTATVATTASTTASAVKQEPRPQMMPFLPSIPRSSSDATPDSILSSKLYRKRAFSTSDYSGHLTTSTSSSRYDRLPSIESLTSSNVFNTFPTPPSPSLPPINTATSNVSRQQPPSPHQKLYQQPQQTTKNFNTYFTKAPSAYDRRKDSESPASSSSSLSGSMGSPTAIHERTPSINVLPLMNKQTAAPAPAPAHELLGWDDRDIETYYQVIHPSLPVLPGSKAKLRRRLQSCPIPQLRYAVLIGVTGLVRRDGTTGSPAHILSILNDRSNSIPLPSKLDKRSKMLLLIAYVLLYLRTNEHIHLSICVGIAHELDLQKQQVTAPLPKTDTSSADVRLARRLFLILVILDRLQATVSGTPVLIPRPLITLDDAVDADSFSSTVGVGMVKLALLLDDTTATGAHSLFTRHPAHIDQNMLGELESLWDTAPILKAIYHFILIDQLPDAKSLITLLESPLISVSPLLSFFLSHLVSTLQKRAIQDSQTKDVPSDDIRADTLLTYLDGLISLKFPHFDYLRRQITRPKSYLDGLAAVVTFGNL